MPQSLSENFPGSNPNLVVWLHFFEGTVFALAAREQRTTADEIVTLASEIASQAFGEVLLQQEMLDEVEQAKGEAQ